MRSSTRLEWAFSVRRLGTGGIWWATYHAPSGWVDRVLCVGRWELCVSTRYILGTIQDE